MTVDAPRLFDLLPSVYRLRDAEIAGTIPASQGPLEALLAALAEQVAVLDENLEQLYDDQFIETCAPWAVPYIGDLIGYRLLHGRAAGAGTRRAEVAHTIALRRRKGTASMLEQLARDVTGWDARVVEYFQLLATTQYMNHRRLGNRVAPSLRDGAALDAVGTAFDPIPRTLDVRSIARGRGRYNIPNLGIFLWRLGAQRLLRSPATPAKSDPTGRRFRFSPLGNDTPLVTRPEVEEGITHLAEPINVPAPIGRRTLERDLDRYYGPERSLLVHFDGNDVLPSDIAVCDLRDHGAGWAHDAPPGKVAIDPELGRLVVAADVALPGALDVTYHYGAAGELGGGEYPRDGTFESPTGGFQRVPDDQPTIQLALDALGGAGVVEIADNGRYEETLAVDVAADRAIELRAGLGRRPTLELTGPMQVRGGTGSAFALNGLLATGAPVVVPAANHDLSRLRIVHATLVPGRRLEPDGAPVAPGEPSLLVRRRGMELAIVRSIVGAIRVRDGSSARLVDSVVDACDTERRAYASTAGALTPGGALSIDAGTVIGEVRCESLSASNSILLGTVIVVRRQEGCVRFSFAPPESTMPRRHRCQPTPGAGRGNFPRFTSLRYGAPAYCQLTVRTPDAIRRGADDESEMGAFHFLFQPQRESDLVTRLDEYLRVGLEAGIFHES
jgi:hypothetical protein